MALKDVQNKLAALIAEGEGIAAKGELTDADARRIEEIFTESKPLKTQIESLKNFGGVSDWAKQSGGMLPLATPATVIGAREDGAVTVEDKGNSILYGVDGMPLVPERALKAIKSAEYKDAFRSYLRAAGREERMGEAAVKTLQEGSDTAGGYLVVDDMQNRVIAKEPTPLSVAGRVTRLTTSKDAITFPKVPYTTDNLYTTPMRVTWTGEIPAAATTHRVTDPSFGQARIPIYTAMMSLPLTRDMIEDSGFDILGWCSDKFRETIDLLYENMILNGAGVAQPWGITANTAAIAAYVASGAAGDVTGDGFVNTAFALPPQYDTNSVWVMSKLDTGKRVFKLKDGEGRYLWGVASEGGGLAIPSIRRDLLGYPILYSELMPTVAANSYSVIFGDLKGYYLVNRVGFSIEVLRELYAETNTVLLLGRIRFGGALVEDWRLRLMKMAAS